MLKIIIREILALLIKLCILGAITQCMLYMLPGDPVEMILEETGLSIDPDVLRKSLGLDLPVIQRILSSFSAMIHGDFGNSLFSKKPVLEEIFRALKVTGQLVLSSFSVSLIFILCALFTIIGLSRKRFFLRKLFKKIYLLWNATPTPILALSWLALGAQIQFWGTPLPLFWLGILYLSFSITLLYTRFLVQLWEEEQPKILWRAARARGISATYAHFKYALSPRLGAFFAWVGTHLGQLLAGVIIGEVIFNFQGLGTLFLESLAKRDYPMIQGTFLWGGLTLFMGQFAGDLVARYWNPKSR